MNQRKILRRFLRNRVAVAAACLLVLVVVISVLGPYVTPDDPYEMHVQERLAPPSLRHPFGRDNLGRDLLARMVLGGRLSLAIAVLSVVSSATAGTILGIVAGYLRGPVESIVMRTVDVFLSFPTILLAMALVAVLGPSVPNLVIVLAMVSWTQFTRVVRGVVLTLREREFIEAARASGASSARIIFRHLAPNSLAEVTVLATLGLGNAIVSEASLSFLGLGIQPPTPSWGEALSVGLGFIREAPHMVIVPGLLILLTVLSVNLLGDGLRDTLDPRLS